MVNPPPRDENAGFSLVEIAFSTLLIITLIFLSIKLLTQGQQTNSIIESRETAELGWQRFVLQLREDARSASDVKCAPNLLELSVNRLSDNGVMNSENAAYCLEDSGNLAIINTAGKKNIEFAGKKDYRPTLVFNLIASGQLHIKVSVNDTIRKTVFFEREEVIDFKRHE